MNYERMMARGLHVLSASSGQLDGFGLRFNKRSRRDATFACANVIYAPGERVEGVLYHLATPSEIIKLDPHEGTPYMYSRELFWIQTLSSRIPAWTYIANPAVIDDGARPERWYVEHLLAGKEYLSAEYWHRIDQTPCKETVDVIW
tara:strand:- start:651 stop:1088 length:438 start_codon:yes stop_codon:yes gene_type:complete